MAEIRHRYTDSIVCPHCGYRDRDPWERNNGEEGAGETECGDCEKAFTVQRIVTVKYVTEKPDG